ncbi:MAG: hypothetical protein P1V35_04445 [Planctomycetota bacterium]|nr:hypothetical protein [Planctomycetota bacterium]
MKIYQSLLLAVGLCLTACASLTTNQSAPLTVHVVEASGGA